jgi:HEPN domain-containing protein
MNQSFASAAGRHLQDAKIVLSKKRWDNAIYLAGYVVECAFKLLVEQYFKNDQRAAKKFGHDLKELEGKARERLGILYPRLEQQLPVSRIQGTVLGQNHPERRYYQSGYWTEDQANSAVECAEEIYRDIIPRLVLNGYISSKDI